MPNTFYSKTYSSIFRNIFNENFNVNKYKLYLYIIIWKIMCTTNWK